MTPNKWAGTGALHVLSKQLFTPDTLRWDIAGQFLAEFNESQSESQAAGRAQVYCTVGDGASEIYVARGTMLPVLSRAYDQQGDLTQHFLEIRNPSNIWSWEGWLTSEPWSSALVGNGFASLKSGTFTFTEPGDYLLRATAIDEPRMGNWDYSVSSVTRVHVQ